MTSGPLALGEWFRVSCSAYSKKLPYFIIVIGTQLQPTDSIIVHLH